MINKRGLSGVVTVVILVALSVALIAIVWGVVQNMVEGNLDEAGACSVLFSQNVVSLNNDYSCYTESDIYFGIEIGDVELDAILVKVEGEAKSKTYRLDSASDSPFLTLYSGGSAHIPNKNGGITYKLSVSDEELVGPYSIGVVPVIDGHTCDEISRINQIDNCALISNFP